MAQITGIRQAYFLAAADAQVKWPADRVVRIEHAKDVYTKASTCFDQPGTMFLVKDDAEIWKRMEDLFALLKPLPVLRLSEVPNSVGGVPVTLSNVEAVSIAYPTLLAIRDAEAMEQGTSSQVKTPGDLDRVGTRGQGEGKQTFSRGMLGATPLSSIVAAASKPTKPIRVELDTAQEQPWDRRVSDDMAPEEDHDE